MYAKHPQKTLMDLAITAKICTFGYNCTLIKNYVPKLWQIILFQLSMTELSFCDWLDKEVAERTDITESTREHHRTMARKVRESRIFATFKDLTLPNIIRFDDAIKKTLSNPESVRNYHKRLKPYIAKALRLEYIGRNPYDGFLLLEANQLTFATSPKKKGQG